MDALPVIIDFWEIECCGKPFAVGDEVSWRLVWAEQASLPGDLFVTVDATVETVSVTDFPDRDPPGVRRYQRVVRAGPIRADCGGTESLSGPMTLRGALFATWHGGGLEPTSAPVTGVVRRIRTLRQRMRINPDRRRRALVPGTELRDVTACPQTFDDSGDRADLGVVVDLDIRTGEFDHVSRYPNEILC